jgi:uncharacterized cupredoxin-like copper-binding protein
MTRVSPLAAVSLVAWGILAGPALARPGSTMVAHVAVTAGKPSEFKFTLSTSTVKRGIIVLEVTNRGSVPHDFRVCTARNKPLADECPGTGTRLISPGQSKKLRIGILLKGTYEYLCTVPGHAAAGMKGTLKVT